MQTDPQDDRTLIDGTGSLVTYLVISGTLDAYSLRGDGFNITNLNLSNYSLVSGSGQIANLLRDTDLAVRTITAQQMVISSSVYHVTSSFSSGSTIFGNSADDIHQFTGSVLVSGSITGTIFTSSINNFDVEVSRSIAAAGFAATLPSGVVSSSVQTIQHLTGTNIVSGSGQRGVLGLGTTDNVTFAVISGSSGHFGGNVIIDGVLTARAYYVSASVINKEILNVSGSSFFGNSSDDVHQFTGSMYVSGSVTANSFLGTFEGAISSSAQISALGFISGSGSFNGSVEWDNVINKPSGIVSSSTQTISHLVGTNIVSGSGQRGVLGLSETDSPTFQNISATNGNFDGNVLISGTLTARAFIVSASVINKEIINVSGSSFFGNSFDDVHQFTGSLSVTGSFIVPTVNNLITAPATIGSLVMYQDELYIYM